MLSIVIATYNRSHTLQACLASVLSQTDMGFEIIVVDDGSTDGTKDILAGFTDSRLRTVQLPENKGASFARNQGIKEAKGEYVLVWDSDDTLYPNALAFLRLLVEAHPDAIVVSVPARMMRGDKEVPFPVRTSGYVSLQQTLCKYLGNNEKVRLARKDAYLKAPYVSRNVDFIVAARLAAQGQWFHSQEPLGDVFLDTPGSLTQGRKKFDYARSANRAPHLDAFLVDFGHILKKECKARYVQIVYGTSIACACAGMKAKARMYACEVWKHAPLSPRSYAALLFSVLFPGRSH